LNSVDDEPTETPLSLEGKKEETDTLQKRKDLQREKDNTPTDTSTLTSNYDYKKQGQIIANGKILLFDSATNSYAYIGDVDPSGNETYRKAAKTGYDRNGNKRGGFGSRQSEAQERPARFVEKPARQIEQKMVVIEGTPLQQTIFRILKGIGKNSLLGTVLDYTDFLNKHQPEIGMSIEQLYAQDPVRFTTMMEYLTKRIIPDDGFVSKQHFMKMLLAELPIYVTAGQPKKVTRRDKSRYGY
jgi:hypothetical protein